MRQIEAFRAVYGSGTVTSASRLLHISQPSVTRLIADLERAVGFKLFVRQRRGMQPTAEATLLHQQVERSYLGLQELEAAANEIKGHGRQRFVLGLAPAVALELAPRAIAAFSRRFDLVHIDTRISTTDRLLGEVRSARVSLAVVAASEEPSEVNNLLVRDFPYLAMVHREHPLAAHSEPIDLRRDGVTDLITPPASFLISNCPDADWAERIIRSAKIEIEVHFAAAALARHRMGVALVDPFTALFFERDPELVMRAFVGAPRYPLRVVEPRRLPRSHLQDAFIAELEQQLAAFGENSVCTA